MASSTNDHTLEDAKDCIAFHTVRISGKANSSSLILLRFSLACCNLYFLSFSRRKP